MSNVAGNEGMARYTHSKKFKLNVYLLAVRDVTKTAMDCDAGRAAALGLAHRGPPLRTW